MKITPKQTAVVMVVLIAAALVWEILAAGLGTDATISEWFWTLTINYPAVPFLLGALVGHLVWQRRYCVNCGKNPIRKEGA